MGNGPRTQPLIPKPDMGYTLLELRGLLLQHLGRTADDDSLSLPMLNSGLNRWRRECWAEARGPVPDSMRLDIIDGKRDYLLPAPAAGIASVSVRAGTATTDAPYPLTLSTVQELGRLYASYPSDQSPLGTPLFWVSRPSGVAENGVGVVISLYPTPDTYVSSGLIVQMESQAAELTTDASESPLPRIADETAAWHAAYELYPFRSREPGATETLDFLGRMRKESMARLVDHIEMLDGGEMVFAPFEGFGPSY